MKALTADQLQSRKDKAVRFVRNVLQDDDRADEIESESLEDYAARRKVSVINPTPTKRRNVIMAGTSTVPTKADLQNALDEIAQKADDALDPAATRKELAEALQDIYDLASGDDESDDDDADDNADDDDE